MDIKRANYDAVLDVSLRGHAADVTGGYPGQVRAQNPQHCSHLLRFRPARRYLRRASHYSAAKAGVLPVWRGRWRVSLAPITSAA